MANYSVFKKRWGLAKESSRGVAESAPSAWFAPLSDSEIEYKLNFADNMQVKGYNLAKDAPIQTTIDINGKIRMYLRPSELGEFLHMMLGDASSAQQGGSAAYLHTFTPGNVIQPDSYTLFVDRGVSVKKYNLCNVKTIKISRAPDAPIIVEIDLMGRTEASGSIGSPSFAESGALSIKHDTFTVGGASNTQVKQWEVILDNGLIALHTTGQQQGAVDLLATEHAARGSFLCYHESDTERDKFVAGTVTSLQINIEDTVAIASTYNYLLNLLFDEITYRAYPYEVEDNLIASKVEWVAHYYPSNSRIYRVNLQNAATAYS